MLDGQTFSQPFPRRLEETVWQERIKKMFFSHTAITPHFSLLSSTLAYGEIYYMQISDLTMNKMLFYSLFMYVVLGMKKCLAFVLLNTKLYQL